MPPRGWRKGKGGFTAPRTPTPAAQDADEEMEDADESRNETPAEEDEDADAVGEEEEDVGTPAQDEDGDERPSSPVIHQIPRRRGRIGRPPKNRPPDWNTPEPGGDGDSERGTPDRRRGRGRGRGGFRGRGGRVRGGPSHVTRVPIDKEGNMMDVVDDEVALPEDEAGETKVDKFGNLLGGRDYRVRVFTIKGRGDRLYMLSTEPARCTGFRDSYLFFTKHMQLYKIIINDDEKKDMIERDLIPHSYKGRAIGVCTARSVFREFGARIIIGGKKVIDDYYETAARERGDVEGELADPYDKLPPPGEPYNKNQYVAWHGASAVYHTGGPSVPMPNGKPVPGKKKINITSANWQYEHARAASRFNSTIATARRTNIDGVYDPHTNVMFYPSIIQPTHVKWEQATPTQTKSIQIATQPKGRLTNGTNSDHAMDVDGANGDTEHTNSDESKFPAVPPLISRNFIVTDTYFISPPYGYLGIPGPDGDSIDTVSGTRGLSSIPKELYDELPPECKEAFDEVKATELEWKSRWGTESHDGSRARLKIGFGYPV